MMRKAGRQVPENLFRGFINSCFPHPYFATEIIDRTAGLAHFFTVKSLHEIEEAIARLPSDARRQLVQDMPVLCPEAFPADGWDAILRETTPRAALTSLLDKLDAEYQKEPDNFLTLNDKSLRDKK